MTDYLGLVRARPEVLDPGTSWEAAALQTRAKVDLVKTLIVGLLAERGAVGYHDEELVDAYNEYAERNPAVPRVTPQSIRTRRALAHRQGLVNDSGRYGRTRTGSRAVIWTVPAQKTAPQELEFPGAGDTLNPAKNRKESLNVYH